MELSASSEATSRSATQCSKMWWNPEIYYRFPKSPAPIHILNDINPARTTASHFRKTHINVSPFTSGSSYCSLPFLAFPVKLFIHSFLWRFAWPTQFILLIR
jgi:hypothetical protein